MLRVTDAPNVTLYIRASLQTWYRETGDSYRWGDRKGPHRQSAAWHAQLAWDGVIHWSVDLFQEAHFKALRNYHLAFLLKGDSKEHKLLFSINYFLLPLKKYISYNCYADFVNEMICWEVAIRTEYKLFSMVSMHSPVNLTRLSGRLGTQHLLCYAHHNYEADDAVILNHSLINPNMNLLAIGSSLVFCFSFHTYSSTLFWVRFFIWTSSDGFDAPWRVTLDYLLSKNQVCDLFPHSDEPISLLWGRSAFSIRVHNFAFSTENSDTYSLK